MIRPAIHAKGGDYDPRSLPETAVVERYGGQVVALPFVDGHSTTDLIASILEADRRMRASVALLTGIDTVASVVSPRDSADTADRIVES